REGFSVSPNLSAGTSLPEFHVCECVSRKGGWTDTGNSSSRCPAAPHRGRRASRDLQLPRQLPCESCCDGSYPRRRGIGSFYLVEQAGTRRTQCEQHHF